MCSLGCECRVVVVGVRSRGRVGEERRRVQKLAEVMGLGLITCGEGDDAVGVHTLLSGVVQVCHELHVGEEEERGKGTGTAGREGSKRRRSKRRDRTREHGYGDGTNGENLSQMCG